MTYCNLSTHVPQRLFWLKYWDWQTHLPRSQCVADWSWHSWLWRHDPPIGISLTTFTQSLVLTELLIFVLITALINYPYWLLIVTITVGSINYFPASPTEETWIQSVIDVMWIGQWVTEMSFIKICRCIPYIMIQNIKSHTNRFK